MNALAVLLIASGVMCMAGYAVLQRHLISNKVTTERDMLVFGFACATATVASSMYWLPEIGTHVYDARVFWLAIALTTLVGAPIHYASTRARALAPVSKTAAIQGMTPLLITMAAILLNEAPTAIGIVGIVLIAGGTWIHNREGATTWKEYLLPLRMLWLPHNHAALDTAEQLRVRDETSAVRYAFLSACLGTLGLLFSGVAARNGSIALGFTVEVLVLSIIYAIVLPKKAGLVRTDSPRRWLGILGFGILYGLHMIFIVSAFRFAPVAYVGSLKRMSILATVFLAWFILNEHKAGRRMAPAGLIALGAALLVFDPGSAAIIEKTNVFFRSWLY